MSCRFGTAKKLPYFAHKSRLGRTSGWRWSGSLVLMIKIGIPYWQSQVFCPWGESTRLKDVLFFSYQSAESQFQEEMWIFPKNKYFRLAQAQARKYLFSFPSWVSAEDPNTTGTRRWAPRNGTHLCNKGRKKVLRRLGNVWNWWERPFLNPLVHHEKKLWKTVG